MANGIEATSHAPLANVLVLDLSQFLAGPFCSQILADLGASVIKIEPPSGDSTRHLPPHFVGDSSAYFCSANRNKRSVALNLKAERGRELCLGLARNADIVLENFRPGVIERLGLGYTDLKAINDDIILCSISGFGQTGPDRDKPAYDMVVQALAGTMSITGEPGRAPVRMGAPLGDLAAGFYAAIGALAALVSRDSGGGGKHVDVAMFDSQLAMLSYQAVYYLVSGEVPGPQGRGHVSIPTYRTFTCSDHVDIVVTANTEGMWRGLCDCLGLTHLADDPRYARNDLRFSHKDELWAALEERFGTQTSDEWLRLLQEAGIPSAPVNTVDRALAMPGVEARRMLIDAEEDSGATVRLVGNPIKFAETPETRTAFIRGIGADTESVLREVLGLSESDIEELAAAEIVRLARPLGNKATSQTPATVAREPL